MRKQGIGVLLLGCFVACLLTMGASNSEPATARFSRTTIDLGMVVADIEASARFYQEVIGFTEAGGFSVSADMAGDTGLTDYKAINVRIRVSDMTAALARLKAHAVAPVKKPYQLGNANNYLTLVKDPDGNIIELIGPMK